MASKTQSAKRTRYSAVLTLYVLIVVAVLVVINWLAKENNKSFDTTTNKQFTLSDQTIKTVKNLKNDVSLTYFSETRNFDSARDLLDRYSNLSHKLHVDYVDPVKKPEVAQAEGFRAMGGVVVHSGGKTEESSSVSEEGITNAIIRSTKTTQKTVCFVTGAGEMALDDQERTGASMSKEQLEKNTYKTESFSLLDKPQVPADCAVVVIAGPRRDYLDTSTAMLKTYVEGGGHVLIAVAPALGSGRGGADQAAPTPVLDKLLEGWGVTPDNDLVLDPQSRLAGFSETVPLGVKYESQPIVRDLARIVTVFPVTQSLTVTAGKGADKLVSTSDSSVSIPIPKGPVSVDPATAKKGPFVLAAVGSIGTGAKQGRFVAFGSASWMSNQAISMAQVANRDLFLNSINWLAADEDLISIRPKDPDDRRISLTRRQSTLLFLTSVVFLPLLAIAFGVATWLKRR
jgi:ABC-type uncharacterized transport system involved in gliding motility auxiliary subunit